ncbi:MAG: hypothetical protein IKH54_00495 [Bacilli bacterium]|nr:hypothetical protein [Bacilli bacterium]
MSVQAQNTSSKKKILIFLLLFLVCLFLFQEAYAKYRKFATVNVNNTVARWNIKINNEDIGNKTTLTNNITPTINSNANVNANVLAPGSSGYFDVVIDATNADVSFTYEIGIGSLNASTIADLKIDSYAVNDFSNVQTISNGTVSGTITHNTASTTVRVFFSWIDDGTDTMNNQADTAAATGGTANADVLVTFHLTQVSS